MDNTSQQQWTTIIKPRTGWFDIDLKELWQYRDLVVMFVKRSFATLYKQTILGPAWILLNPLITTLIFNYLLLSQAGNVAVAAYGIIANIAVVVTALFNGVSQGLQPVASLAHGQMDTSGEARIYASARTIAVKISLASVAAALFFAPALTEVFNSEGSRELAAYAVPGMRLYFLGFLLAAVNIVKSGFYSAVGKGYLSSVIALSRGFLSITVSAFVLSMVLGITGIWLAFPVSELITWLLSLWAEQRAGRRQNSGSEGADSTPL